MDFETNGLSREEIRKRRRKRERTQALVILAAVLLVVVLVISGIVFALVRLFSSPGQREESTVVDAVTTESVVEEPQESVLQSEDADMMQEDASEKEETDSDLEEEELLEEMDPEPQEETEGDSESDLPSFLEDETGKVLEELVEQKISAMTLEQKVAGLFFVTPGQLMGVESDVTAVGSQFGEKIGKYPVGGIVLDESNMTTKEEFETLVSNLRVYVSKDTFIGIEDKGGEQSPFVAKEFTENVISSHQEIGAELGAAGAYSAGISIGGELRQYGINVNFAPNVDVSLKEGSVAAQEGFGVDAATAAELGKNLVKGMSDQNIFTAVGHFPGYGDVSHDGNSGQVISQRTKEDLAKEYAPYIEAIDAGADFVMVSHVSLPKVRGDKRPASLSKEVITDIIRTEWEYDGVVITDFMNRSCMFQKYTYAEAAVGAIEAGADMILAPKNFLKSYNGILDAVNAGTLTEERIDESLRRIYRVKLEAEAASKSAN